METHEERARRGADSVRGWCSRSPPPASAPHSRFDAMSVMDIGETPRCASCSRSPSFCEFGFW